MDREPAPDVSSEVLAACLLGPAERPSEAAARAELRQRLQQVLERSTQPTARCCVCGTSSS